MTDLPMGGIEQTRCAGSDVLMPPPANAKVYLLNTTYLKVTCAGCGQWVDVYSDGLNLRIRDHLRDV